ncbi:MAG: hypothetical protein AB2693_16305 [Candidatus Thiodiazotropha sp.]
MSFLGVAIFRILRYAFRCRLGWYGPDCSQCTRYNGCLNGICYEPYQCICKDGWAGVLCDIGTAGRWIFCLTESHVAFIL